MPFFVFTFVLPPSPRITTGMTGMVLPSGSIGCSVLGFLFQFEEVMTLCLILRIAQHPYHFLLKKVDCSQWVNCTYMAGNRQILTYMHLYRNTTYIHPHMDIFISYIPNQKKKCYNRPQQYFNRTLLFCVVGATVICTPLAVLPDSFGRTGALCWLRSVPMQFYWFFSLVLLTWAIALTIQIRVARVADHRYLSRLDTVYHGEFFRSITRGLIIHFLVLSFVLIYSYIFRIASRLYLWIHGRENLALSFLEIFAIAVRRPPFCMSIHELEDSLIGYTYTYTHP